MAVRSWLRNLFARKPSTFRKAPARFRPRLECLEDRAVPATFTVNSLSDDGSAGTLRHAIQSANNQPGQDTITFDPQVFGTAQTIRMGGDAFRISESVTIIGPDVGLTLLGAGMFAPARAFTVLSTATVAISNLTMVGFVVDQDYGGAIANHGDLTLTNCNFYSNSADWGGALFNFGTLTVSGGTFYDNFGGWGGRRHQ